MLLPAPLKLSCPGVWCEDWHFTYEVTFAAFSVRLHKSWSVLICYVLPTQSYHININTNPVHRCNWARPQNWRKAPGSCDTAGERDTPVQLPIRRLGSPCPSLANLVPERGAAERAISQPWAPGDDVAGRFWGHETGGQPQQHLLSAGQEVGQGAGVCRIKPQDRRELQCHSHTQRPVWVCGKYFGIVSYFSVDTVNKALSRTSPLSPSSARDPQGECPLQWNLRPRPLPGPLCLDTVQPSCHHHLRGPVRPAGGQHLRLPHPGLQKLPMADQSLAEGHAQ